MFRKQQKQTFFKLTQKLTFKVCGWFWIFSFFVFCFNEKRKYFGFSSKLSCDLKRKNHHPQRELFDREPPSENFEWQWVLLIILPRLQLQKQVNSCNTEICLQTILMGIRIETPDRSYWTLSTIKRRAELGTLEVLPIFNQYNYQKNFIQNKRR